MITIVAILFVIFCSVWVYTDAKDRDVGIAGGWAIGVLLLWIVFFPLYLIKRPTKAPIMVAIQPPTQDAGFCKNCGKYSPPQAAFCMTCGEKIQAELS